MTKVRTKLFFILIFPILFLNTIFSNIIFYGTDTCPYCLKTKEFLLNNNISFIEKDITKSEIKQELLKLYQEFNVPLEKGGIPTLLVKSNGEECLIIGKIDESNKEALKCKKVEGITVIKKGEEISYSSNTCSIVQDTCGIEEEHSHLSNKDEKNNDKQIFSLSLVTVILAALVDSINPCVLAIMAFLLLTILKRKDRKKALLAGLIFTFTITTVYFLIGLGILKAFTFIDRELLNWIAFFLLLTIGLLEIKAYFFYKPGFLSVEMPMKLRKYAKKAIEKATSLKAVFLIALFLSLTLVPCTSGPYLAILSLISSLDITLKVQGIFYLIVYNLFFSLPMLIITFLVYLGLNPKFIIKKRNEKIREIHLISGIIFLILAFIIFFFF